MRFLDILNSDIKMHVGQIVSYMPPSGSCYNRLPEEQV